MARNCRVPKTVFRQTLKVSPASRNSDVCRRIRLAASSSLSFLFGGWSEAARSSIVDAACEKTHVAD